jgi:hypothetical protein
MVDISKIDPKTLGGGLGAGLGSMNDSNKSTQQLGNSTVTNQQQANQTQLAQTTPGAGNNQDPSATGTSSNAKKTKTAGTASNLG